MFSLILILLLAVAATFGIFFLIFKGIWKLLKKTGNKWPLIISGVLTGTVWTLFIVGVYAVASLVMAPFKGLIADISAHPTPVYGEHTYHDDTYPLTLSVYDGMQFADWITLYKDQPKNKTDIKFGIDTNIFKQKDNKNKPVAMTFLAVHPNGDKTSEQLFSGFEKLLADGTQKRKIEVSKQERTTLDGKPAYLVTGTASTNNGLADLAGVALYDGDKTYYVLAFNVGAVGDTARLEKTVTSLRVE